MKKTLVFLSGIAASPPRSDQGTVPIRLSSDPPTAFLPSIER